MTTELVLDRKPIERGTLVVTAKFRNEKGDAMTPNSGLTWSLYRRDGSYVNTRQQVSMASSSEVDIVLTDADLPQGRLFLLIEGTYNSEIDGQPYQDLSIRDECEFQVKPTIN